MTRTFLSWLPQASTSRFAGAILSSLALCSSIDGCAPLGAANSLALNRPSSDLRTNEMTAQLAVSVRGPDAHAHATLFDPKRASVELTEGDRIFCNGVELTPDSASRPLSYDADLPAAPATAAYRFELRRSSGEIASAETDTPTRLTISAPSPDTPTRLGEAVTVAWSPAQTADTSVIIKVVVVEGPCTSHLDGVDFPDTGSAVLDGSTFAATGAGTCTFDLLVTRGRARSLGSAFAGGGVLLSMEDTVRVVASP